MWVVKEFVPTTNYMETVKKGATIPEINSANRTIFGESPEAKKGYRPQNTQRIHVSVSTFGWRWIMRGMAVVILCVVDIHSISGTCYRKWFWTTVCIISIRRGSASSFKIECSSTCSVILYLALHSSESFPGHVELIIAARTRARTPWDVVQYMAYCI